MLRLEFKGIVQTSQRHVDFTDRPDPASKSPGVEDRSARRPIQPVEVDLAPVDVGGCETLGEAPGSPSSVTPVQVDGTFGFVSAMDDYLGRVQAIIWRAAEYLSPAGVASARHLTDHGEPSEGMLSLAWAIVNEQANVPADLVRDIREHGDLVPAEAWPPLFDAEVD